MPGQVYSIWKISRQLVILVYVTCPRVSILYEKFLDPSKLTRAYLDAHKISSVRRTCIEQYPEFPCRGSRISNSQALEEAVLLFHNGDLIYGNDQLFYGRLPPLRDRGSSATASCLP